ncbi:phosphatase PAP2 family protein [uncultured Sphingorhabdus sp.]|uniref:phosphatase PAP2 family protein n=1 Tax=uncultured Sphingorhabdus sp. TaxID=1686106 RepID=UPI002607D2E1|nr:phosphatase PAP2 family protein [uncultured Sphingorhabdus sp.]HMS20822.1 phosphatase PAP2 family protein [Sphingorhabdus sp.]
MINRFVDAIKADIKIIFVAALCCSLLLFILASKSISGLKPDSIIYNTILFFAIWFLLISFRIIRIMFIDKPKNLINTIIENEININILSNYIRASPVIILLCIYMPIFSSMKSAIPLFNNFQWDPVFIEWDRWIFGKDAWKIFHPLLFQPIILAIIALLYHMWILLIYAGGLFFAFKLENPDLRQRYFISYFLVWTLIGGLMATYFSSVGPCFADPLLGIADFEPLMDELTRANDQFPIIVLDVQKGLIQWQHHGERGLGSGITAMPSMHVSLALLFFLAVRHLSQTAKWVFALFFCITCVGSIVTGYHYAVDGIVAAAATLFIWMAVGFAFRFKSSTTVQPKTMLATRGAR